MRYGVYVPKFGPYGNARILADLALTLISNSSPCSSSIRPSLWSKCALAIGKLKA